MKADIALHGNPTSELWDITCHMGSHSVTCHPTQVNAPHLTPATQAGTRFTYPRGIEGWVDLVDLIAPRPGVEPVTFRSWVWRRTTAPPRLHRISKMSSREKVYTSVVHFLPSVAVWLRHVKSFFKCIRSNAAFCNACNFGISQLTSGNYDRMHSVALHSADDL